MRSSASVSWCLLSICHFLFAASSCFIIFLSVPPIVILYHKASRYFCLNHGGHLTCSFYISVFPFASCLPAILFMDHSAHRRWHMYIKRSFFNCFSLSFFFFCTCYRSEKFSSCRAGLCKFCNSSFLCYLFLLLFFPFSELCATCKWLLLPLHRLVFCSLA